MQTGIFLSLICFNNYSLTFGFSDLFNLFVPWDWFHFLGIFVEFLSLDYHEGIVRYPVPILCYFISHLGSFPSYGVFWEVFRIPFYSVVYHLWGIESDGVSCCCFLCEVSYVGILSYLSRVGIHYHFKPLELFIFVCCNHYGYKFVVDLWLDVWLIVWTLHNIIIILLELCTIIAALIWVYKQ